MRSWIVALLAIGAIACMSFSWWGLNTAAGRAAYDEMDGIIPFAAGPLGLVLGLVALVVWWRSMRPTR